MKWLILLASLICLSFIQTTSSIEWKSIPDGSFKKTQLSYPRVREAYRSTSTSLKNELMQKEINSYEFELFIRIFKEEEKLETWLKHRSSDMFVLFKSYDFCAASGVLGPKRKQGDYQVPEGFYYIDRFNPASWFHLSLGINYPNPSDRILGNKTNLGGDIFLHGACVSVGCVAITDEWIEEVYMLAVEAKTQGQSRIPVHIFPSRAMPSKCATSSQHQNFWCNLETGYTLFKQDKTTVPVPNVDAHGTYIF